MDFSNISGFDWDAGNIHKISIRVPLEIVEEAFFRDPLDKVAIERLEMITGSYRKGIFENEYGDYWKQLFCWPESVIYDGKRHGVVLPVYQNHYFFEHGSINNDFLGIKGGEKEGKWFAAPTNRLTRLDPRERGDWRMYLKLCLMIARATRRMHAAGLAHSDLSYKNVLISPSSGHVCMIDVDGLVVPGKYPPDVVGTPDFIAPEVIATIHLDKEDTTRVLPSRLTDRHALAVLIYQYLLLRHPLRGSKIHDMSDPANDETLSMGEKALFIEHPTDKSNKTDPSAAKESDKFWLDIDKLPYTITGPYLSGLFKKAFIEGLHNPSKRPTADEWESALIKTVDLVQPCENKDCAGQWYTFDNNNKPICPFCDTPYNGKLPTEYKKSLAGSILSKLGNMMKFDFKKAAASGYPHCGKGEDPSYNVDIPEALLQKWTGDGMNSIQYRKFMSAPKYFPADPIKTLFLSPIAFLSTVNSAKLKIPLQSQHKPASA